MHCRGAISAETISQAMLWMANGRPESERPGPFADAVMRRLGRTSSGFLQVEDLEQRPLGSVEYARELWGDFWLYFAGYKNQVMQTEPNHRTYSPDAEQEIRQLKHELANWGQGLIEASKRLAAVLTGSGTELLATTKNVLSGLALLGQAGKCRHLLPYRIMLNHMQEHLFDPDPKKSVQELARLFNEYGEGMLWISMRR